MSEKHTVLVVEDNDFVRMQIAKFLTDAGYGVVETKDGAEALDKIGSDIDIMIVDVRMEPMGGFDFIRSLKGMDIEKPAILVTGDQSPDLLNDAARLGVAAVLMKPVQRERLVKTVERTLQHSVRAS